MRPGDKIGEYILERQLGAGGSGTQVFVGVHIASKRRVAIRVPEAWLVSKVDLLELLLLADARAMSVLSHPNIVRVLGVEMGTLPFVVMELVDGRTLGEMLRTSGPLPLEQATRICREIALALDVAHAAGIVNGEVEPYNILIDERTGAAKLASFKAVLKTRLGVMGGAGAHRYLAPEWLEMTLIRSPASVVAVDSSIDVFALGAILYELLAGTPAFAGTNLRTVIPAVLECQPTGLAGVRPQVPPNLAELVTRMLAKAPAARPASGVVAETLAQWADLDRPSFAAGKNGGPQRAGALSSLRRKIGRWL